MGGFFSMEHHSIYDKEDIRQVRDLLTRIGIIKNEKRIVLGEEDTVLTANHTRISSKQAL